jgi:ketosteroid isomerase-like protein
MRSTISQVPCMKAKLLFLLLLLIAPVSALLSLAQRNSESGAKILALENKWNEAYQRGDVAAMNSLLADDFVITVEDGNIFSKSGYIAHVGDSDNKVTLSEMSDLKVRVHADVAVVTGVYHEKGTTKGKPYEFHDRLTDVWLLADSRWQVIASHYSIPVKD